MTDRVAPGDPSSGAQPVVGDAGLGLADREAVLLRSMVESVRDYAILMLDVSGHIVTWNEGAQRLKGWTAEEIIGRHFSAFYPTEDVTSGKLERELETAAREGRFEEEGWRVRKDGSRFWASVVITAVRGADGELLGFGKVTRDLTSRHEAELALRESEERFRSVTESAVDAIVSANESWQITSWNPGATRLFGYERDRVLGESLRILLPDEQVPIAAEYVRRALTTPDHHRVSAIELLAVREDGVQLPIEVSVGSWTVGDVDHFCAIMRDITERKRAEAALQHLVDHDSLTGLFNRRRFEVELNRVVAEDSRYSRPAALLVIDLDGFKTINDRHGHSVGDELVSKIGALLRQTVRDSDVVARLGGDEFGIVLLEADRARAEVVAEKIVRAVQARGVIVGQKIRAQVTASIGITLIEGDAHATGEELLIEADRAMYDAKARGRNRHAVYSGSLDEERPLQRAWLPRLREAIDEDRFELYAQRIVGITRDDHPHYELLLRLRDNDGQLLLPGAFLYNAERFDLIGEIDRWVLSRAVLELHRHAEAGSDLSLAVNLSGQTMTDLAIAEDLAEMLAVHPIAEGRLVIEVTETAAIVNINRASELARELRRLRCRFALDDFGSGFASFYYLKHLAFDYLKIDGEFISRLVQTPADQLVVKAVVDIAQGLGTLTIAEFVENEATVARLTELGVDYGQGFYFAQPAPLADALPPISG
jgi:diguanylate cyclase (GGDEF)-like protein/PAS domain S-box-containing protein